MLQYKHNNFVCPPSTGRWLQAHVLQWYTILPVYMQYYQCWHTSQCYILHLIHLDRIPIENLLQLLQQRFRPETKQQQEG